MAVSYAQILLNISKDLTTKSILVKFAHDSFSLYEQQKMGSLDRKT